MNVTLTGLMTGLFADEFAGPSWWTWRALAGVLDGRPLDAREQAFVSRCTNRRDRITSVRELWAICGRRAGKSRFAALLAVWLGLFKTYSLASGERGVVMVIACDRSQAKVLFNYIAALVDGVPMLAGKVVRRSAEAIDFDNGISIEVHVASFRSVRGRSVVAAICDEIAFWQDENSASPDAEVIGALKPAMMTTGGMLICISSPYARKGAMWKAYRASYGEPGRTLIWQAGSLAMNDTIPADEIARQREADPALARSEFDGEFREDIEALLSEAAIARVVVDGRRELPRVEGVVYQAFVDVSGGSADSYTWAVAHRDRTGCAVLDLVRETKPPFEPDVVTKQCCEDLRGYGLSKVVGDKYGAAWVTERFASHGMRYEPSEQTKSELYNSLVAIVNSKRAELLDLPRLVAQLAGLERRTTRGGRDVVDHRAGQNDDVANSAAGAVVLASGRVATTGAPVGISSGRSQWRVDERGSGLRSGSVVGSGSSWRTPSSDDW